MNNVKAGEARQRLRELAGSEDGAGLLWGLAVRLAERKRVDVGWFLVREFLPAVERAAQDGRLKRALEKMVHPFAVW